MMEEWFTWSKQLEWLHVMRGYQPELNEMKWK